MVPTSHSTEVPAGTQRDPGVGMQTCPPWECQTMSATRLVILGRKNPGLWVNNTIGVPSGIPDKAWSKSGCLASHRFQR